MTAEVDRLRKAEGFSLHARFPELPPDVMVRTKGQLDALAAELARAHDLTLNEAQVALSEVPWTH